MPSLTEPETIRGLIVLVLLIIFGSGAGFRMLGKLLRGYVGKW